MMERPESLGNRPERMLPDEFWIYSYKVAMCPLKHFHDWEKCIYAHPGEKARRRSPRRYQAVQCPEARSKMVCPRGEDCPCTHHLFEYWLHPDRYMTCLCELGPSCNRPICFFAHHPHELRPLPDGLTHAPNAAGSSKRRAAAAAAASAAVAAAATAASSSNSSSPGLLGAQGTALELRIPSATSLASSAGSYGPDGSAAAAYPSTGGPSLATAQHQQQQHIAGSPSGQQLRPGFSALSTINAPGAACQLPTAGHSNSSLAAVNVLNADALRQLSGRAASTGTQACPSVLVLEAPPPVGSAGPTSQEMLLLQAAQQQFGQLQLSAASAGWLSPISAPGQSSNMSLATSTSSTLGLQGLSADAQMLEAQQQQLLRARSMSPRMSPAQLAALGGANSGARDLPGAQQQQQPSAAVAALLGLSGQSQLAAMQAAMEESPEHLSFSLWDLTQTSAGPGAGAASAQVQHMPASMGLNTVLQVPEQASLPGLQGFGGFSSGYGSSSMAGSSARQVFDLASAAADRLLAEQQGRQTGSDTILLPVSRPLSMGGETLTMAGEAEAAREARLTLLRAWVNAADGGSGVRQGGVPAGGRVGRLSNRGLAVIAQDVASVLSPGDVSLLAQHLAGYLQN